MSTEAPASRPQDLWQETLREAYAVHHTRGRRAGLAEAAALLREAGNEAHARLLEKHSKQACPS